MKLNRRKMFGVFGGVAAAASLGGNTQSSGYPGMPSSVRDYGRAQSGVPQVDPGYLAQLKRTAGGQLEDFHREDIEDRRRDYRAEATACNIDALRSVSAPIKRLMHADRAATEREAWLIRNAARDLRRLLRGLF